MTNDMHPINESSFRGVRSRPVGARIVERASGQQRIARRSAARRGATPLNAFAVCVTCGITSIATAQSRQIPAPTPTRPIVLTDAHLHPVTSPEIESGYIVIDDGTIKQIGSGDPGRTQNFESLN